MHNSSQLDLNHIMHACMHAVVIVLTENDIVRMRRLLVVDVIVDFQSAGVL